MNWKIAEAKQQFSEVVRRSASEPQLIFNRDRLVAVLVPPQTFKGYEEWRRERQHRTVADAFAELRALCEAEGYELELPERSNRPNPFAEALDERTAD